MMRSDAFNFHVDPARMEITGTQHIPILHVCDLDNRESKGVLVGKKILASLLYRLERIRKCYNWWKFYKG